MPALSVPPNMITKSIIICMSHTYNNRQQLLVDGLNKVNGVRGEGLSGCQSESTTEKIQVLVPAPCPCFSNLGRDSIYAAAMGNTHNAGIQDTKSGRREVKVTHGEHTRRQMVDSM